MKNRILSIVLMIAMVLTFMPTATFADSDVEFHYLAIGDSITNGFGLDGYYKNGEDVGGFNQVVPEAYPALIKAMLEKAGKNVVLHQFAGSGMRSDDLDAILNPEHEDDVYTSRMFTGSDEGNGEWFKTWGKLLDESVTDCETGKLALREAFTAEIKRATLITYDLGNVNLGTFIKYAIEENIDVDNEELQKLIDETGLSEYVDIEDLHDMIMDNITGDLGDDVDIEEIETELGPIVNAVTYGLLTFIVYSTDNLEDIIELNRYADLVVVGLHNYVDFLKVEIGGQEIDFGEAYGQLYRFANLYIGYFSDISNKYYFADLENAEIPTFIDELLVNKPGTIMQGHLDSLVGSIAKDNLKTLSTYSDEEAGKLLRGWYENGFEDSDYEIVAKIAEEKDLVEDGTSKQLDDLGLTLEEGLKLADLYYHENNDFVPTLDKMLDKIEENKPEAKVLKVALKDNDGKYISFEECKPYLDAAADLDKDFDLSMLDDIGKQLDDLREYGRVQEILLDCVTEDPIDLEEILGELDEEIDMDVIGEEILDVVSREKDDLSNSTKTLINAYFITMFPEDKEFALHPNAEGHKVIADIVYDAYKKQITAQGYKEEDALRFIEDLIQNTDETGTIRIPSYSQLKFRDMDVKGYTSLGDSTVMGYGLEDFDVNSETFKETYGYRACSKYAYPMLLKESLGIENENFNQLAMVLMRSDDILYVLQGEETGDDFYNSLIVPMLVNQVGGVEAAHEDYVNSIKNSDIVSVAMGGNNLGTFVLLQLSRYRSDQPLLELDWDKFVGTDFEDVKSSIDELLLELKVLNPDMDDEEARIIAENAVYEYASVMVNSEKIFDEIHNINPDAKIIIMSMYNPAEDLYYEDDTYGIRISVGKALGAGMLSINEKMRTYAIEHNDYSAFINVEEVPLILDDMDFDYNMSTGNALAMFTDNNSGGIHPSIEGHEYMYLQIIRALGCPNDDHIWDEGKITEEATCVSEGIKTYTCLTCGATATESVRGGSHDYGEWKKVDENLHKRVCNRDSSHVEIGNHIWDEGRITKEPTENTYGIKTYTCELCDATMTEKVDKLPHVHKFPTTAKATLTKNGKISGTCSECGENVQSNQTIYAVDTVKLSWTSTTYNGNTKKPAVTVTTTKGKKLTEGTHYTVTYASGRKNAGTYKVTVKGKGDYSFTKELSFKIKAAGIDSAKLSYTSTTYNGKVRKPSVTVVDKNGNTLIKDTDYTVKYASGRKNVGTYKVTVKGIGNYSFTKELSFKIKSKGIHDARLSYTSYTYTGKVKTPTVTVVDEEGNKLKKDTDYTVSYASGRKNVGTYKVTVKGKGNYSFTKTLTFKINPPKATLSSAAKKSSTSITVKWKKVSNITGYQIKYVASDGTSKTVKVKGASTVSKAVTGLTEGETYDVSIRTYKTVDGTTYYSGYSTKKSVTL